MFRTIWGTTRLVSLWAGGKDTRAHGDKKKKEKKELQTALEASKKRLHVKEAEVSWWKDTAYIYIYIYIYSKLVSSPSLSMFQVLLENKSVCNIWRIWMLINGFVAICYGTAILYEMSFFMHKWFTTTSIIIKQSFLSPQLSTSAHSMGLLLTRGMIFSIIKNVLFCFSGLRFLSVNQWPANLFLILDLDLFSVSFSRC